MADKKQTNYAQNEHDRKNRTFHVSEAIENAELFFLVERDFVYTGNEIDSFKCIKLYES